MKRSTHIIVITLAAALGIAGSTMYARAQGQLKEIITRETVDLPSQDEDVTARDLGIREPRVLPTNAFYVLKDLSRGLRTLLAQSSLGKAELTLRFADECLIEIQSVSARTKDPNVLKPVLEHYQAEISRLRKRAGAVHLDPAEAVNDFLTRFTDHQLRHYKFLGRLEKEISPEAFGALKHAKEEITETLVEVPLEFENPESFRKRLEATMESQNGSRFKDFKNLEIIKALQEKAPEKARDSLRHAEENAAKRFLRLSMGDLRGFESYVNEIGGNEALHAAVIDELKRTDLSEEARRLFADAGDTTLTRIETRLKQFKDEAQKEEFLGHLEKGTLEHILTIRELEKNLAPETRGTMLEVKAVALADFGRILLRADTSKKRERLFKETERFHGAKTIDALEEVAKTLPDTDQKLLTEMKQSVVEDMKEYPDRSRTLHSETTENAQAWRMRLERTLKEADDLKDQPELRDGTKESWYQSLLAHARDTLKENANIPSDIGTDRTYEVFSALENGMYLLKNAALYGAMRARKTPGFLRVDTQMKLALIFLDLKPQACGPLPSSVAIPLVCKNGRWQRSSLESPQPAKSECRPTGCSGQICADQDIISTCGFRPEYACYKTARCERQPSGGCGWTLTQELQRCVEKK